MGVYMAYPATTEAKIQMVQCNIWWQIDANYTETGIMGSRCLSICKTDSHMNLPIADEVMQVNYYTFVEGVCVLVLAPFSQYQMC